MNYTAIKWCADYLREHGEGQQNLSFIVAAEELDRVAVAYPPPTTEYVPGKAAPPAPPRIAGIRWTIRKSTLRRLAMVPVWIAAGYVLGLVIGQGIADQLTRAVGAG